MNDLEERLRADGNIWRIETDGQFAGIGIEPDPVPSTIGSLSNNPERGSRRLQMAVVAVAVLTSLASLAGLLSRTAADPATHEPKSAHGTSAALSIGVALPDRASAIAGVLKNKTEIRQVDQVAAILLTDATAERVLEFSPLPAGGPAAAASSNSEVWAVTVIGKIHPSYSVATADLTFDWGVYLLDQVTGDVLGVAAGNGSPPVF